jgi:SAM-dependent methyltransferase
VPGTFGTAATTPLLTSSSERNSATASKASAQAAYLKSRFTPDPRRDRVWQYVVRYLMRFWDTSRADVLDVGAGYCSFINQAPGRRSVAVDIHAQLRSYASPGVETILASATDLSIVQSDSFDVVFASNLLEHLTRDEIQRALLEFRRVLRVRGRLILIQPNFRLCAKYYFDDYTHLTPLSDRSLCDLLTVTGFDLVHSQPRFLPLSLRSRGSRFTFLLPLYLRSPWRPFAGQMLVVAEPAALS